jgi:hypothetical protein
VLKDIELIGASRADKAKTMTDGMSAELKTISRCGVGATPPARSRARHEIGYTDATARSMPGGKRSCRDGHWRGPS